jgi:transcriptional regulator GlxA family with amidase domain
MTHVSILVPHGSALLNSIVGLFNIFNRANDHAAEKGREPIFDVHLVGIARHADLYGGRFSAKPDLKLAEVTATDLVIVPALAGNIAEGIRKNAALIPWIKEQYRTGAEIAGLCTGAFFIADTGLISDQHCSAHWFVEAAFRKEFSQINQVAERTVGDGEAISSNGGAYSFIQKLLECVAGRQAALACAAVFEATFNRECQSVVTISHAQKQRSDKTAKQNRLLARDNSTKKMTVKRFAAMFEVSGRDREGSAHALEESMKIPEVNADLRSSSRVSKNKNKGSADYKTNSTTFRELFRTISGGGESYSNG